MILIGGFLFFCPGLKKHFTLTVIVTIVTHSNGIRPFQKRLLSDIAASCRGYTCIARCR